MTAHDLPPLMQAWVLHGAEDMRLEERRVPVAGTGEVLLRVGSVGVCGSDRHFYAEGRAGSDVIRTPVVLGHEFGGTIVGTGAGVDPQRIGERVSVEPLVPDWTSREAREGRYNIDPSQRFYGVPGLDGGLQQFVTVPSANAHRIPDDVSDNAAAMVETVSVALNGVRQAQVRVGSRVLIAGAGPVGLFVLQLCRAAGASHVALVEPHATRRATAARLGADVHADLDDAPTDYDAFLECTGVGAVRHDGFLHVRPGGRVVFIGVGAADASIPMSAVIEREITLHGVMRYAFTWPTVIALIQQGTIDADSLVTRELPLRDALTAWTTLEPGDVKTMIKVQE